MRIVTCKIGIHEVVHRDSGLVFRTSGGLKKGIPEGAESRVLKNGHSRFLLLLMVTKHSYYIFAVKIPADVPLDVSKPKDLRDSKGNLYEKHTDSPTIP